MDKFCPGTSGFPYSAIPKRSVIKLYSLGRYSRTAVMERHHRSLLQSTYSADISLYRGTKIDKISCKDTR